MSLFVAATHRASGRARVPALRFGPLQFWSARRPAVPTMIVFIAAFVAACAPASSRSATDPASPGTIAAEGGRRGDAADLVPTPEQVQSLTAHPGYATEPFVVTNLLAFSDARGRQIYYGEYAPRALELIRSHGGEVVWAGAIDRVFARTAGESWDDMIQVRWPSRSAFVAVFGSPEYAALHSARQSGLARTVMLITDAEESRTTAATVDSAQAAAATAVLFDEWLDAYEREDAESLVRLFAEDGIYAANTGQLLRGRAGIREGVRGWFALRPQILASLGLTDVTGLDVEQELLRFRTAGDAVYSLVRFVIRVEPIGCLLDAGHGLAVWRLQADGEWRIESLTVNRDQEPPEGACGRR